MKSPDKMKPKEIKDILFKYYQWPPSCLPKGAKELQTLLARMRKDHPQIKK